MVANDNIPKKARRKPGPKAKNAPSAAETDLGQAILLLNLARSSKSKNSSDIPSASQSTPRQRLSPEQERLLIKQVQKNGDLDARNYLVMANIGLVHLVAHQFCRSYHKYDDLAQEGILGLIRATETFEAKRSVRFSTYAVYWIRARIQRAIQKLDKDDLPDYLDSKTKEDCKKNGQTKTRGIKISFNTAFSKDGHVKSLDEVLPSEVETPGDLAEKHEISEHIHDAIKESIEDLDDDRLHTLVSRRLLSEDPDSLEELGKALDLSREGVRLLESKLLRSIKKKLLKLNF